MSLKALHKPTEMESRYHWAADKPVNPSYDDSRLYEMAALMAKDSDFAIFRAFSELNFLNILHLQHDLTKLEIQLSNALKNRSDVTEVIIEIRQQLKEYSELKCYTLPSLILTGPKMLHTWRFML